MNDERKGRPSASSMDRYRNCPRSFLLEQEHGMDEPSAIASQGEAIHEAMAEDDLSQIEDEDDKEIAQRLERMKEKLVRQFARAFNLFPQPDDSGPLVLRECRLWNGDAYSAKADYIYMPDARRALIIDYKSGYKKIPEAARNYQLRTQAVCLYKTYPTLETIWVAVAAYRFREDASVTEYRRRQLLQAERELLFIVHRCEDPNAEAVPGQWCTYCRAKHACRAAATLAILPLTVLPPAAKGEEAVLQAVSALSLADLAFLNTRRALAEKVFKAVANRLRNYSAEELATVGLELQKNTRSKITRLGDAFRELVNRKLLLKEECLGCCTVVLKRIVDLAVPRLLKEGVPQRKMAVDQIKLILEKFSETVEIAPSIKPKGKETDDET